MVIKNISWKGQDSKDSLSFNKVEDLKYTVVLEKKEKAYAEFSITQVIIDEDSRDILIPIDSFLTQADFKDGVAEITIAINEDNIEELLGHSFAIELNFYGNFNGEYQWVSVVTENLSDLIAIAVYKQDETLSDSNVIIQYQLPFNIKFEKERVFFSLNNIDYDCVNSEIIDYTHHLYQVKYDVKDKINETYFFEIKDYPYKWQGQFALKQGLSFNDKDDADLAVLTFISLEWLVSPTGSYNAKFSLGFKDTEKYKFNDLVRDFWDKELEKSKFNLLSSKEDPNEAGEIELSIKYKQPLFTQAEMLEKKEMKYIFYFSEDIKEDYVNGNYRLQLKLNGDEDKYSISTLSRYHSFYQEGNFDSTSSVNSNYSQTLMDNIGYFSTVGIWKYTSTPTVEILNTSLDKINANQQSFVGKYTNSDQLEKVYSYCFNVYDKDDNLYLSSGELLHNHENDISPIESTDAYNLTKGLKENEIYTLEYCITTVNGYKQSSSKVRITDSDFVQPEIKADLIASYDRDNAVVILKIIGHKYNDYEIRASGSFCITRSSSKNNFTDWDIITKIRFYSEIPSSYTWRDYTVENGVVYKYALQQYNKNKNFYSGKKYANEEIEVFFDDCFLFDGEKQLKVEYNPKISSFKTNLLEQKTNTIGSQYPFFFKNSNVNYKEFPISGLISYLSDKNNYFISDEELGLINYNLFRETTQADKTHKYTEQEIDPIYGNNLAQADIDALLKKERIRTTNLVDYNIKAEQIFKNKVLDFLTDGTYKLFRSSTEGNFIVRLMNSSLSPNDTLGRMLHTFSTTAIEAAEFNYQNLFKYGFLNQEDWKEDQEQIQEEFIDLKLLNSNKFTSEKYPGYIKKINFYNIENEITFSAKGFSQLILPGDKEIEFEENDNFIFFVLKSIYSQENLRGLIKITYKASGVNLFDSYERIELEEIPFGMIDILDTDLNSYRYLNSKNEISQDGKNGSLYFYETTDFYYLKFINKLEQTPSDKKDNFTYCSPGIKKPQLFYHFIRKGFAEVLKENSIYKKADFGKSMVPLPQGYKDLNPIESYYILNDNKFEPILYAQEVSNYKPSFTISINNKILTIPENTDYEIISPIKIYSLKVPYGVNIFFSAIRKKVYINK